MSESSEKSGQPAPPRRTPRWKIVLVGFLLLACVAGSVLLHQTILQPAQELGELLHELDQKEPGWRFHQLLETYRMPTDAENGALVVLRAHSLITKNFGYGILYGDETEADFFSKIEPFRQLNSSQIRVLEPLAEPNGEALRESLKVLEMPQGKFPLFLPADRSDVMSVRWEGYKAQGVNALLLREFLLRLQRGDEAGAWECLGALDRINRYMEDTPLVSAYLGQAAEACRVVWALERLLGCTEPREDDLRLFQQQLGEKESKADLLRFLRIVRADTDALLESWQTGKTDLIALYGLGWRSGNSYSEIAEAIGDRISTQMELMKKSPTKMRRSALKYHTDIIHLYQLPPKEALQAVDEYNQKVVSSQVKPLRFSWINPQLQEHFLAYQARLRCALLGVATERFHQKYGRWPENLDKLKPEFLETIPLNPLTGDPPSYTVTEDSVVIACDDPQGRITNILRSAQPYLCMPPKKSIGFRLWNPDRRNQPPLPEKETGETSDPQKPEPQ